MFRSDPFWSIQKFEIIWLGEIIHGLWKAGLTMPVWNKVLISQISSMAVCYAFGWLQQLVLKAISHQKAVENLFSQLFHARLFIWWKCRNVLIIASRLILVAHALVLKCWFLRSNQHAEFRLVDIPLCLEMNSGRCEVLLQVLLEGEKMGNIRLSIWLLLFSRFSANIIVKTHKFVAQNFIEQHQYSESTWKKQIIHTGLHLERVFTVCAWWHIHFSSHCMSFCCDGNKNQTKLAPSEVY